MPPVATFVDYELSTLSCATSLIRLSTTLLYQIFLTLKKCFTSDLPWWHNYELLISWHLSFGGFNCLFLSSSFCHLPLFLSSFFSSFFSFLLILLFFNCLSQTCIWAISFNLRRDAFWHHGQFVCQPASTYRQNDQKGCRKSHPCSTYSIDEWNMKGIRTAHLRRSLWDWIRKYKQTNKNRREKNLAGLSWPGVPAKVTPCHANWHQHVSSSARATG